MKKRLLALCSVALLIATLLAGCGKNGKTGLSREELAGEFLCAIYLVDEDKLEKLAHPNLVHYFANLDPYDAFDCVPYDAKVLRTMGASRLDSDEVMELEEEVREKTGADIVLDKAYKVYCQAELSITNDDGSKESFTHSVGIIVGEYNGKWYGIWPSN